MNRTVLAQRGALTSAALISGCLLLAACGSGGSASSGSAAFRGTVQHVPAASGPGGVASSGAASGSSGAPSSGPATQTADLAPASQSIIYTASLTVRAGDVSSAAQRAIAIAVAAGGYTAGEHVTSGTPGKTGRTVDLTLKIPVPGYQAVLARLSSPALGRQISMQQRASDVTAQVADVNSLVTSEQDAIRALQGLLGRAGSVSGLLDVQEQISGDESALNSLLAQQRALDHETTYATVTMTLVSPRPRHHAAAAGRHGFLAGLSAGWRALRHATAWVLTAAGAALPFLAVIVVLAGIGYAGWRRAVRRRARPTAAS
jgi:Domain of unknown function (DUF4349)